MCSTVQERISTCGRNAIVKIGERTNIRPQKSCLLADDCMMLNMYGHDVKRKKYGCFDSSRTSVMPDLIQNIRKPAVVSTQNPRIPTKLGLTVPSNRLLKNSRSSNMNSINQLTTTVRLLCGILLSHAFPES